MLAEGEMDSVGKEVVIRKLRSDDADAISEIYSLITKKPANEDFKKLVQQHAFKEGHEAHFVAEFDGKVVGFMISYILSFGFGAEQSAYIATMGVHPKFMGQGIGAEMTKEIFKFYKSQGISRVYTSVRWDSTDLLSFCKTMGFGRSEFINLNKDLE
jgi:ribosomal protein S18 acetylase RimI-like enzyme